MSKAVNVYRGQVHASIVHIWNHLIEYEIFQTLKLFFRSPEFYRSWKIFSNSCLPRRSRRVQNSSPLIINRLIFIVIVEQKLQTVLCWNGIFRSPIEISYKDKFSHSNSFGGNWKLYQSILAFYAVVFCISSPSTGVCKQLNSCLLNAALLHSPMNSHLSIEKVLTFHIKFNKVK